MMGMFPKAAITILVMGTICLDAQSETISSIRRKIQTYLDGRPLKVVTITEAPYMMFRKSREPIWGNDKFEGFVKDLLDLVADKLGIRYTIYPVPDGLYGGLDRKTGEWSGMIKEIQLNQETYGSEGADVAAASLTISRMRMSVVDFTKPFLHISTTLLVKRPKRPEITSKVLLPLYPFTAATWGTVIASFILFTALIWGAQRFSSDEKQSVGETMWLLLSTFCRQGYEQIPKQIGARVLFITWFAYVTILVVTYTAGFLNQARWMPLSSFSRPRTELPSFEEIVNSEEWRVGVLSYGSTESYIRASVSPTLEKLAGRWMTSEGEKDKTMSYQDGVYKVMNEDNYGFLVESSYARYVTARQCPLTTVGEGLFPRGYGLALGKNQTVLREALDHALLSLMETGQLEELEEKWWSNPGVSCEGGRDELEARMVQQLHPIRMFGAYVIIAVGIVLSLLVTLADILLAKCRK